MLPTLIIDKLSLTLQIPHELHQHTRETLEMHEINGTLEGVSRFSDLLKGYAKAYKLFFDDVNFCTLQIMPRKPGQRFMRLEWNPSKAERVCPDSMTRIIQILNDITPTRGIDLIVGGKITRIDFAFNLPRITIEQFDVITTLRKSASGKYEQIHDKFGKRGTLNSRYIGKANSDYYLLIYDKRLESEISQIVRNQTTTTHNKPRSGLRRIVPSLTRFELRLHDIGSWSNLRSLPNPFLKYDVIGYGKIGDHKDDHMWKFFINSCKLTGAQASLSLIENRRERKRYADSLKLLSPPSWWKPIDIWGQLTEVAYQTLGVPF